MARLPNSHHSTNPVDPTSQQCGSILKDLATDLVRCHRNINARCHRKNEKLVLEPFRFLVHVLSTFFIGAFDVIEVGISKVYK